MAADALGVALLSYFVVDQPLPNPSPLRDGQIAITADLDVSAKIAVLETFRESHLAISELAKWLGKEERETKRILDPLRTTKLPVLMAVLAVLGRRLILGGEAA